MGCKAAMAVFLLFCLTSCMRETPSFDTTYEEEQQDEEYLWMLSNAQAVNTIGVLPERRDYNRTIGREPMSLRTVRAKELRLNMVGFRLAAAAYPICPEERRVRSMFVGLLAKSDEQPTILWAITPFNQQDRETLKNGDKILGMGNEDIPRGVGGGLRARAILADYANRGQPLKFRVDRDGEILRITQQPWRYCKYNFQLKSNGSYNAAADGYNVFVNSGAFNVLHTDDELANIMGHEIGHNVMKHGNQKFWLALLIDIGYRAFMGNVIGAEQSAINTYDDFGRDFELEADYLGAYLVALAGYDPEAALSEMQIAAMYNPDNISRSDQWTDFVEDYVFEARRTHPEDGERYTQVRKAVEHIKDMQARGLKPLPDFLY